MPNRVEKTANSIPIRKVDNFTYWILLNVESFVLFSGLPITKGTNGEQIFYHPHYPALRAEICKDCRNVIPIRPKAFSKPLTKKQLGEFQECFQMFDKVSFQVNFFLNWRYSLLSLSEPQLYNLEALPFTYGQYVAIDLDDKLYNSVTVWFCASRKYVFHIGLNREQNVE